MIEGISHSAESYVLTLSEEEKHIALRVEHLDEECRELCAKYIEPVSYSLNNMFITSWNKDDYSNLDFYDIFDRFSHVGEIKADIRIHFNGSSDHHGQDGRSG